ncbi:hypothetical protein KC357_g1334 [Hortaea werneckii]|nr:hypothetical protein KC357_g1334 [Hortaea werneckii]
MVLYKRKPILIHAPPKLPDNAEVYVMRGTNEVFQDYEDYLRRLDYLRQKKFVDAVNGKSGMTFFDALTSENKSSDAIENVFPDVLKDPILRKVQFSTISRIDDLVSSVFDEFKKDFFPGEEVLVVFDDGEQMEGVIREKAKFPMIRGPDGAVQRAAFSRYFVRTNNTAGEEALVDDIHIRRDKKMFTKQNLRSFLKNSLQREAWIGAPWLVKEHLAIQYRLPMEIPGHLLQDAKLLANKVHNTSNMRPSEDVGFASSLISANDLQQQMLQMKPPKGRRSNKSDELVRQQQELVRMQQMQQQHPGAPPHQLALMAQQYNHSLASHPKPPPPPPIRYPIEDLDVAPKRDGYARPQLKFQTDEQKEYVLTNRQISFENITMESQGMLLEVWNTLNVQCEVYYLDSFTFDDFVDAMQYKSSNPPCQLLEEVYCAVLNMLVDKNGKLQVKGGMVELAAEVNEESSEAHDDSEYSTPQPDVPARSTRSRLSHVDPAVENQRTPTTVPAHRAAEMLGERSWRTRLGAREMEDGGWQLILVGLLHQLSANAMFKARCDKILAELAPMEMPATKDTAWEQFTQLDVNLRVSALQMITILSLSTPAVKEFLEHCSDDMTDVRKRKIEHQREKKAAMEELQNKDRERKILLPENMPASPSAEQMDVDQTPAEGDDTLETNEAGSSDAEDEEPSAGRSLRRGNDRKRKREEEAAKREEERAKKAEAAKQQSKLSKEFKKLLNEIESLKKKIVDAEAKIEECDADLREANVQRTKVLGKDRYCNRYYWFERNGMPFAGLPRSSTASSGYANGRLWVQGPDQMEVEGFIDRTPEEQKEYRTRFNMTVPERRKREEGDTSLLDANEWGYIDDADRLDNLIGWLDDRGEREKKLRKELCEWRDTIKEYMDAYKTFFSQEEAKKLEAAEDKEVRMNTRGKAHEDQTASQERCLRWHNTMVVDELGFLHSRPRKPAAKKKAAPPKGVAQTVGRGAGKPTTRQGGRS